MLIMILLDVSEIFKNADILILFPHLCVGKKLFVYIIGDQVYL